MNATTRLSRGGHAVAAARRESASPSRKRHEHGRNRSTLLTGESEGTTVWDTSTSRVHENETSESQVVLPAPQLLADLTVGALRH